MDPKALATELLEREPEVLVNGHENGSVANANGARIVNAPISSAIQPLPLSNTNTVPTRRTVQPLSTASLDEAFDPQTGGQIGTVAATKTLPARPAMETTSSNGNVSAEAQNADIARQAAEAKASAEARATRSAAGTPYKAVGDSKWSKIKGYSTFQVGTDAHMSRA